MPSSLRVDDRQLADHVWIIACRKCETRIDPKVEKQLGHCPVCGSRFSRPRLMSDRERKRFLRGRLSGQFITHNDDSFFAGDEGLGSIPQENIERLRDIVRTSRKIKDPEIVRRIHSLKKEKLVRPLTLVIPFFRKRK